ncbi:glycosyltransferase family 2 protein [Sphingobacterium sp. HJSM2_6]|uniref:glycosyltransferase family 2 protein n=1 Tax=Sphingobacterium sp. HJSM2_6 TaxID=3366264 RepID=UPI003BEBE1A5
MKSSESYVSIIIPVYNAEDTLEICFDSLKSQTYPFLQLIFINDASTDNSERKINDFKSSFELDSNVEIIILNHTQNKGVASARNTGLKASTGKYMYFVDADDQIESNTIHYLVQLAESNQADIIGFDWFLAFKQNARRMYQPTYENSLQALELMLRGSMRWNLWIFFVRRDLFLKHDIGFIDGKNLGEDLLIMFKLFLNAQKVISIDQAFYHYGQSNSNSVSKIYSQKQLDEIKFHVEEVDHLIMNSPYASKLAHSINFLKLNAKLPLLISDKLENYEKWQNMFPHANKYIWEDNGFDFKSKFLQWMAAKKQYWFLRMYYYLVIKFVYGVIFK